MTSQPSDPLLGIHQDVFDLVQEGALWVDAGGRIQHANDRAAQLLGYSRDALRRVSYFEIDPHYSLLAWKKFWARLGNIEQERLETEFVNSSGKLFSVRGRIAQDLFSTEVELVLVVFTATEDGQRERDLLTAVEDHGNIGSWEWNLTTGQVYVSPPLRRWFALSPERDFYPYADFLGKVTPLVDTAQFNELRALLKQLKGAGRNFERTLTLQADEGSTDYVLRGRSAENELEVYKIYGSMRPAAAAAAPATPLAEGQELAEFSLNRTSDAMLWVDLADKRIINVNYPALELSGYARQDLVGQPSSVLATANPNYEREAVYATLREKHYAEFESAIQTRAGEAIPCHTRIHLLAAGGREYGIFFLRDLRQEAAKREDIQLHRTTLNALNEWVIWVDASNRVVLLNTAATRKLSRRTSRDLTGLDIRELMPDLDIPSLDEVRQEQLDGRIRNTVDYLYTTTSGDERELQVRFAQVSAGRRLFLCIICRDVTAQYKAKRRLQQSKRRVDELTKQLQSENEALKERVDQGVGASGPIVTVSKKYQRILAQIAQVAGTDATVLVTGETGTGKELLAQSIHNFSNRSRRPLVSVNCAALPENLIESELFGHERGAFTGAFAQKKGKFELADGGTIFLDEIGELPLDMQAKLLRALQEGEIQRVGSTEPIHVDVRVVAATNRNLEQMTDKGAFREDLYYRLNVFPIHNPPLRERPEDIPVLVKHFTRLYSERMGRNITDIRQRDLDQLREYDFPGNVRELINLVERAVITTETSTLNLGASLRALRRSDRAEDGLAFLADGRFVSFERMQQQYIVEALKHTRGKVTGPGGAAELLDINGRTLMSKMNKLGINRNEYTT